MHRYDKPCYSSWLHLSGLLNDETYSLTARDFVYHPTRNPHRLDWSIINIECASPAMSLALSIRAMLVPVAGVPEFSFFLFFFTCTFFSHWTLHSHKWLSFMDRLKECEKRFKEAIESNRICRRAHWALIIPSSPSILCFLLLEVFLLISFPLVFFFWQQSLPLISIHRRERRRRRSRLYFLCELIDSFRCGSSFSLSSSFPHSHCSCFLRTLADGWLRASSLVRPDRKSRGAQRRRFSRWGRNEKWLSRWSRFSYG